VTPLRYTLVPGAHPPTRATPGAAGLDLTAYVPWDQYVIQPGEWASIRTGVFVAIPPGYEGQVRPRSGLAFALGLTVLNAPGTIDSDFRGEVRVLLINHGPAPYRVRDGDRIAQLVIAPVVAPELIEVADLDATERGEGGFGSTGVRS
jgi:dUTP pyrophosphatase